MAGRKKTKKTTAKPGKDFSGEPEKVEPEEIKVETPEQKPKRKRRTLKKKPVVLDKDDKFLFGMLIDGVTDVVVVRKGAQWKPTPDEREKLAEVTGRIAVKYLGALKDWQDEIAFLLTCYVYVQKRVVFERAISDMSPDQARVLLAKFQTGDLSTDAVTSISEIGGRENNTVEVDDKSA